MRNTKLAVYGMTFFILCLVLVPTPVVSQQGAEELTAGSVDFRMTSLEQVKKIAGHIRARQGAGVTRTVMNGWSAEKAEDRQHLIISPATATPAYIQNRLSGGQFDSVTWSTPVRILPLGSCDSQGDCQAKTDQMCKNAGHDGVDSTSVEVSTNIDGSKTCSGDCNANGAVAFVTCAPN